MAHLEPNELTPEQEDLLSRIYQVLRIERSQRSLVSDMGTGLNCYDDEFTRDEFESRYIHEVSVLKNITDQLREYMIKSAGMGLKGVEIIRCNYQRLVWKPCP